MKLLASLAMTSLLLTGCAGAEEPPTDTAAPVSEDLANDTQPRRTETATEEGVNTDNPETSQRGNIIKEVGDKAGVTTTNDEPIVTFTINDISTGKCTEDGMMATAPENGHMLFLDITLTTSPDLEKDYDSSTFSPIYGWDVVKPDGTLFNGSLDTSATMFCLPDAQTVPDYVGPGQTVKGTVVLDVPTTSGTLIFNESWMQPVGWEWEYSVK